MTTVDLDPKFRPSIIADVRWMHFKAGAFDVVLAAPPCQAFSCASMGYHWKYGPDRSVLEGLEVVRACFRIIREVRPALYVLENPRGKLRKCIGLPTETIYYCSYGSDHQKPTDLWHNLPERLRRPCAPHVSSPRWNRDYHDWPDDPSVKALWPYKLSLEICRIAELWIC